MASLAEVTPIENEGYLENASYEILMQKAYLYDKAKEFEQAVKLKKKAFQKAGDDSQIVKSSWEVANSYELMARYYKHVDPRIRLKCLDEATEWLDLSEQIEGKISKFDPKVATTGALALKAFNTQESERFNAPAPVLRPNTTSYLPIRDIDVNQMPVVEDSEQSENTTETEILNTSYFKVGDTVWYTYIPYMHRPSDPEEFCYEQAEIISVSINNGEVSYQLGGVEITDYKSKVVSGTELFKMQETTKFIKNFQRECYLQAKKNKKLWSRFKRLFIKNYY